MCITLWPSKYCRRLCYARSKYPLIDTASITWTYKKDGAATRVIVQVVRAGNFINCGGRVYEITNDLKEMT